jgi:hypothetical protein
MAEVTESKDDYAVLSHVWGGVDIDCKTTGRNISEYEKDGIDPDNIPRTFMDAILLTLDLHIQYIWIDSLCIIQDDPEDWQREAAKMASIFRDATLTLSATTSSNCLGGCGYSKTFEPATQFKGTTLPFAVRVTPYSTKFPNDAYIGVQDSPVNYRAWIFQEKLLSQRILHATGDQYVWQCASRLELEDGFYVAEPQLDIPWQYLGLLDSHLPEAKGEIARPSTEREMLNLRWWVWAKDYSERRLSHPGDQYAAFAGVVQLFQDLTGDEPVIGLWKEHLYLHLAWSVKKSWQVAFPTPGTRRPSWTWMSYPRESIEGPSNISLSDEFERARKIIYRAEIQDIQIHWTGRSWTSTPTGTIKIRSLVALFNLIDQFTEDMVYDWIIDPDVDEVTLKEEAKRGGTLHVLALFARNVRTSNNVAWAVAQYMIIKPIAHRENGGYIRIGLVQCEYKYYIDDQLSWRPPGTMRDIILV